MATYEPGARTGTAGNDAGRETLAPADMTRIMLRPIASSLPLGSFAFSVGSFLLTVLGQLAGRRDGVGVDRAAAGRVRALRRAGPAP